MKFPNLAWALADRRIPHYRLAQELRTTESRVSRALRGLASFRPEEQQRIAALLVYPQQWLFAEGRPPSEENSLGDAPQGAAISV